MDTDHGVEESSNHPPDEAQIPAAVIAPPARTYDCIYCKRGFTTAQALGGHMNIHRKDRARGREVLPSNPREDHSISMGQLKPFLSPTASTSQEKEHEQHEQQQQKKKKDEIVMDPQKLEELRSYGKDLHLGPTNENIHDDDHMDVYCEDDDNDVKGKVDLNLGLS